MQTQKVEIAKNLFIGGGSPLVIIAGPCAIESPDFTLFMAKALSEVTKKLRVPFIFKSSFDKANRSSIHSYRGPGLREGLEILLKVKKELKVPVLTDIHCVEQAREVAEVVDVIQIPAFLSRQTDLILAAAQTGKPINVKKGQFLAPWDMKNVIEKMESVGNHKILLTERGVSFGFNRLVVDMTSLPIMREMGYPVLFDATHSVQLPGGEGNRTGGVRKMVPYLARAAVAVGIDALFLEVHENPAEAKSDATNCLALSDFESLVSEVLNIDALVRKQ